MAERRRAARLLVASVIAAGAVVAGAGPAAAHAVGGRGPTNFVTELTSVAPRIDGVEVEVLDFGDRLAVTNTTGADLIVFGYEDDPYLRVGPRGVFENRRSPATYVNADREGETAIPPEADPEAEPEWRRVSGGRTARWHDHRVHWMGGADPPAVRRMPDRAHVLIPEWMVPMALDGEAIVLTGTLRWEPGPSPWPWLGVAGLFALGLAAVAWAGWGRVLAVATVVLVAGDVLHSVGIAWAPGQAGNALGRFAAGSAVSALGWLAGLYGARLLWRRDPDGAPAVALAGLVVLLVGGLGDLAALSRSQVPFVWDEAAARLAVAGAIGLGAGLILAAVVLLRRTPGSLLAPPEAEPAAPA